MRHPGDADELLEVSGNELRSVVGDDSLPSRDGTCWIRCRFPICVMNWGCSQRCSTVGRRGSSRMGRPPPRARAVQITKRNSSGSSFWKKIQTKDEVLAELMAEHIALRNVRGCSDQRVATARSPLRPARRK